MSRAWKIFESSEIGRPVSLLIISNRYLTNAEVSRRLGFLRFQSVSDSRAFIEHNFSSVVFYGPNPSDDRGTKVRIAFSRERDDRNRNRAEGDWTCPMVS